MARKGLLIDVGKCIGCETCSVACKLKNNTPEGVFWTKIHRYIKGSFPDVKEYTLPSDRCMHCEYPVCVSVCPEGAKRKTENGPVLYDAKKCIGCFVCEEECPFQVSMEYEGEPPIQICDFCADRQESGMAPVCASVCPTGAINFGDRKAMLGEAKKRVQANGNEYVHHIYGEKEAGGTSLLYITPIPFKELGFPTVEPKPLAGRLRVRDRELAYDHSIIGLPSLAAVGMGGLSWFIKRKEEIKRNEDHKQ